MIKKISLILMALLPLFFWQITAAHNNNFDPEKIHFSKIDIIKSWVAEKYYLSGNPEFLKSLQHLVAKTVSQNPESSRFVFPIENDNEITQNYGNSLLTISEIELPFLQFVHAQSKNKSVITLEIAAGAGWVSWKVPLTFQNSGTHYVNELSKKMYKYITHARNATQNILKTSDLTSATIDLQGNCFNILNEHSALKNKVDAIFIANFEHFLNPKQHQKFITLIEELLTAGGQAFLYVDSFLFGPDDTDHPLYSIYKEREMAQDLYPGFMRYNMKWQVTKNNGRAIHNTTTFSNINCPEYNSDYLSHLVRTKNLNNGLAEMEMIITRNYFTPEIYRSIIATHPKLEVLDIFFLDKNNNRIDKWPPSNNSPLHVAVIIKKKTK